MLHNVPCMVRNCHKTHDKYGQHGLVVKKKRQKDQTGVEGFNPNIKVRKKNAKKYPSIKTMQKWLFNGKGKATDGCWVDPVGGTCPHGKESWIDKLFF